MTPLRIGIDTAALREQERAALVQALTDEQGAVRRVAERLGVSVSTIERRIREHKLVTWHRDTFPRSGRQPSRA